MFNRRLFFKLSTYLGTEKNAYVKHKSAEALEASGNPQEALDYSGSLHAAKVTPSATTLSAPLLALAVAACRDTQTAGADQVINASAPTSAAPTSAATTPAVTTPPAPTPPAPAPVPQIKKPASNTEAARFLMHAQFAVDAAEVAKLSDIGYIRWLDGEIAKPVSDTATVVYDRLGGLGNGDTSKGDFHGKGVFFKTMWQQFFDSEDQFRKRAAFALSEYFVLGGSYDGLWHGYGMCHYWDILNKYAFGNFRELLEEVTLNASMGVYLSLYTSKKEDPKTGRVPDENYARELMQLFTIGLEQLNIDGTVKKDASGNPIPTYTNDDVTNVARAISGWEWQGVLADTQNGNPWVAPNYVKYRLTADPAKRLFHWHKEDTHSTLEAKFLGVTISANTDADAAMKTVLDTMFNHANTPVFFSKQMIQRLVTSNPSPQYVERVAKVFINNGQGVRGDLGAVFKAILTDDEALSASGLTSATFGKVREPFIRLIQMGRTFNLKKPASGKYNLYDTSAQFDSLGQMVLMSPSVFNFFRPGYTPAGTAIAANGKVAPEFQIVNEVSTIGYANFIYSVIRSKNVDFLPDYTNEIQIASDSTALVDRITLLMTANQLSQATKDKIKRAVDSIALPATNDGDARFNRVTAAIFLTMVSPQYLVQK
jgi:uncharacterized protein (DUF1800 family)